MNCLLNPTTDAELNEYNIYAGVSALDSAYATAPMAVVRSSVIQPRSDEEDVYSSFEQAISGRLEELQQKLRSLSDASLYAASKPSKEHMLSVPRPMLSGINWQQVLRFSACAFIFTLLGFDIMGLLTLFVR